VGTYNVSVIVAQAGAVARRGGTETIMPPHQVINERYSRMTGTPASLTPNRPAELA
jgi:hypothetical protein